MKAWLLDQISSIDTLRFTDIAWPAPAAGEAVLEMELAALNPADRYLAEGLYPANPPMPHILGRDGLGTIVEIGAGVDPSQHKPGDRRILLRGDAGVNRAGTFAQRVAVPVDWLVAPPAEWTVEQSAGAALVYLTAFQALTMWGALDPGIVLVTGASGGVGAACVHLARAMGHEVVALSRDSGKRDKLMAQGARIAMDPSDPQWRKQLKEMLAGLRVDLAIDNIGGTLLPQVIDVLGEHGRVSCVGRLAGPVPNFNTASLIFRRIRLGGVAVNTYSAQQSRAVWREVVQLLDESGMRPLVDSVWQFHQIQEAFARLAAGPMGKVLLAVK